MSVSEHYPRPEPFKSQEEKSEACETLLRFLLKERGMIAAFSASQEKKRRLIREYMNVRAALPVPQEILEVQDRLFWTESLERGIVSVEEIPEIKNGVSLWEGDITRLNADAIVNAANSALLGCFLPSHNCIDNVIHSAAGMQLRDACAKVVARLGRESEVGEAHLTLAYNLPSKYVIHTVGPFVGRELGDTERQGLRSAYTSCLNLAEENNIKSIAFCCISTGVFNFPRGEAAEIAVGAVLNWKLRHSDYPLKVIFNTFLPEDTKIYREILRFI
ncbi:MAG: protein-ADP-ribose hydrolase [Clostridia bacterium]|nr:protein-ADP-ribose hydrolase [Clostridia bacterium]